MSHFKTTAKGTQVYKYVLYESIFPVVLLSLSSPPAEITLVQEIKGWHSGARGKKKTAHVGCLMRQRTFQ